jgi:hypothetical protein
MIGHGSFGTFTLYQINKNCGIYIYTYMYKLYDSIINTRAVKIDKIPTVQGINFTGCKFHSLLRHNCMQAREFTKNSHTAFFFLNKNSFAVSQIRDCVKTANIFTASYFSPIHVYNISDLEGRASSQFTSFYGNIFNP